MFTMNGLQVISCIFVAVSYAIGLPFSIFVIYQYWIHRNRYYFQKRKRILVNIIIAQSLAAIFIENPLLLLFSILDWDHPTNLSYEILSNIVTQLTAGFLLIYFLRIYLLYYNHKFSEAVNNKEWRTLVNPSERNFFIAKRKSLGSSKYMSRVALVFWLILVTVNILLHKYTPIDVNWTLVAIMCVESTATVVIWRKYPKLTDTLFIREELREIILACSLWALFSVLWLIYGEITMATHVQIVIVYFQSIAYSVTFYLSTLRIIQHCEQVDDTKTPRTEKREAEAAKDGRFSWEEIVSTSTGYDAFMAHLSREFSVENLLFVTEYMHLKTICNLTTVRKTDLNLLRFDLSLPPSVPIPEVINDLNLNLKRLYRTQRIQREFEKMRHNNRSGATTPINRSQTMKIRHGTQHSGPILAYTGSAPNTHAQRMAHKKPLHQQSETPDLLPTQNTHVGHFKSSSSPLRPRQPMRHMMPPLQLTKPHKITISTEPATNDSSDGKQMAKVASLTDTFTDVRSRDRDGGFIAVGDDTPTVQRDYSLGTSPVPLRLIAGGSGNSRPLPTGGSGSRESSPDVTPKNDSKGTPNLTPNHTPGHTPDRSPIADSVSAVSEDKSPVGGDTPVVVEDSLPTTGMAKNGSKMRDSVTLTQTGTETTEVRTRFLQIAERVRSNMSGHLSNQSETLSDKLSSKFRRNSTSISVNESAPAHYRQTSASKSWFGGAFPGFDDEERFNELDCEGFVKSAASLFEKYIRTGRACMEVNISHGARQRCTAVFSRIPNHEDGPNRVNRISLNSRAVSPTLTGEGGILKRVRSLGSPHKTSQPMDIIEIPFNGDLNVAIDSVMPVLEEAALELGRLMRDSTTRFKRTPIYPKLHQKWKRKQNKEKARRQNMHLMALHSR